MKRFLKMLLLFLPLLALLAGVTVFVDPANLLRTDELANKVLEINGAGQNAVMPKNYNDRRIALRRVLSLGEAPAFGALGSSRGIQISADMLNTSSLANTCVTGGVLGDAAALWEAYRQNGAAPKTVIVETDQWFFDRLKLDKRYLTAYGTYYSDFCERVLGLESGYEPDTAFDTARTLLSISYFRESLQYLKTDDGTGRLVTATDRASMPNNALIMPDGSYAYPDSYAYAEYAERMKNIEAAVSTVAIEIADCEGVDAELAAAYEALLLDMKQNGTTPVVLLSPYYPGLYDLFESDRQKYAAFFETDEYIRRICEELGVKVVGSFSPYDGGFAETDFIDALHLTRDATERLVAEIGDA